jgi:hypothetical protein
MAALGKVPRRYATGTRKAIAATPGSLSPQPAETG